jgi:predicted TIM-barrel fold metal-dependent hydrolase
VLEDPRLDVFREASESIDLPLVFEEEFAFTEAFLRRTKTLKVIIRHMGLLGGNPMDFAQALKKHGVVYVDTASATSGTIAKFADMIGRERIIFGSDIPFGGMRRELEKVVATPLNQDGRELILGRNITRLIGLS